MQQAIAASMLDQTEEQQALNKQRRVRSNWNRIFGTKALIELMKIRVAKYLKRAHEALAPSLLRRAVNLLISIDRALLVVKKNEDGKARHDCEPLGFLLDTNKLERLLGKDRADRVLSSSAEITQDMCTEDRHASELLRALTQVCMVLGRILNPLLRQHVRAVLKYVQPRGATIAATFDVEAWLRELSTTPILQPLIALLTEMIGPVDSTRAHKRAMQSVCASIALMRRGCHPHATWPVHQYVAREAVKNGAMGPFLKKVHKDLGLSCAYAPHSRIVYLDEVQTAVSKLKKFTRAIIKVHDNFGKGSGRFFMQGATEFEAFVDYSEEECRIIDRLSTEPKDIRGVRFECAADFLPDKDADRILEISRAMFSKSVNDLKDDIRSAELPKRVGLKQKIANSKHVRMRRRPISVDRCLAGFDMDRSHALWVRVGRNSMPWVPWTRKILPRVWNMIMPLP